METKFKLATNWLSSVFAGDSQALKQASREWTGKQKFILESFKRTVIEASEQTHMPLVWWCRWVCLGWPTRPSPSSQGVWSSPRRSCSGPCQGAGCEAAGAWLVCANRGMSACWMSWWSPWARGLACLQSAYHEVKTKHAQSLFFIQYFSSLL